ncbi:hypothetical protein AB0D67_38170 [Streptosporangium sp. NPDC048047]|uniref:hypothetical protein n=1 Tax=Streptosporangium sp. NPDC048047 TaxID=3155748 RepID=UPI00344495F7
MTSNDTRSTGPGMLTALGVVWLTGTPVLAVLTFVNGFALAGTEPSDAGLATVFGVATLVLGLGAPVVGLVAALVLGSRSGIVIYGLIVLLAGIFLLPGIASELRGRLAPVPSTPLPSGYCPEYSGGDSDCPGG